MSKLRRLRSLVPNEALFDRRVAGESLRALAPAYGVVHTTLSDFFRRPDGKLGLKEAHVRLRAKRRAQQAEERRLTQELQRRAREDAERDRKLEAWMRERPRHFGILGWFDEHEAPRGLTSRQRYNANAETAAKVVASGGGVEQVSVATGLSREHVLGRMDAQIVRRARANDRKFPWNARPDDHRLRRLVPDSGLIRRRAAGEPLRLIAADYGVSHTTLSRYYRRPTVARLLGACRRRQSSRAVRVEGRRGRQRS